MRTLAIVGLGNFGSSFARSLRDQGFDVLAVDSREEAVNRVAEWFPRAVVADVTDRRTLEELGFDQVEVAVVSLGDHMDASILAVLHLRSLGVKEIYVKAISDDHARILELIGATRVIHPEREVAEQLARSIAHPNVIRYLPLLGEYAILEMNTPPAFVGRTLRELHLRRSHDVSVIAIGPPGSPGRLQAPTVDTPLEAGSLLVLIGTGADLEKFEKRFGG